MSDNQEYCCAAGVCCDMEKRRKAMVKLLSERVGLSQNEAASTAEFLFDHFDLLPKAAGLQSVIAYVQAHPYK